LTPSQRNILKTWIAAGLWIGLIVFESTSFLSSQETGKILYPILHFLTGMDMAHFRVWHPVIRKSGHFVVYGTLSFLLFRAWRATLPSAQQAWTLRWSTIAFFMTAFVASLDEWHQTYLPSRTGAFHDVLLDSFAALVVQIAMAIFLQRHRVRVLSVGSS
jgi:VanZ family protein